MNPSVFLALAFGGIIAVGLVLVLLDDVVTWVRARLGRRLRREEAAR